MSPRNTRRVTLATLAVGFALAAAVWLTAEPADDLTYDPLAEKKFHRELERLGGKGNVLAAELQDWFGSLWHGRALAGTILVITGAAAWGCWFVGTGPVAARTKRRPDAPGKP